VVLTGLYQKHAVTIRTGMGLSHDGMAVLVPRADDRPGVAGGRSRSRPSVRPVRWPASSGFCLSLASVTLALTAATLVIAVSDGDLFFIALVPGVLAAALMGCLVGVRRPGHPMGALLSGYGLAGAACMAAFAYGRAAVIHFPGSLPFGGPVMWVTSWDYTLAYCLGAFALPLVFPDGRLLSRRWRPALWAVVAFVPLSMAGNAFAPGTMGGWFGNRPNPYAIQGPWFGMILHLSEACGLAAAVAVVVSMAVRWHRAGHVVRQQLKWFLVTVPLVFTAAVVSQFFPDALMPSLILGAAASLLTAVAIGLAVLRYRLYGIDILISRVVVYGLLSAALAGVYLTAVAAAGGLSGAGRGLSVPVLATVLAAAVLLPVRGRLQRRVDRLFFGDRGAPYAAMARLGRQVEEATTAEPVLSSVVTVVADSLRLPYAAVELRIGDGWVPGAAWGQVPSQVITFALTFQREMVGRLLVGQRTAGERLTRDDERLLANLARQVAPAAHAVALRQALDAARTGQAAAREEERRRLRRDLHDGVGPTLAALVLGVETARTMPAGCQRQEELLSSLKTEAQRAITDIRRIVYGLRPPALDQFGLAGALREEVTRLERQAPGLSIALHVSDGDLADLPAAVEVAAYRIATEAVTNALRHARAQHCEIRIQHGQDLTLEVRDDGAGMPDGWRAGVGITAMRERVAELGGELAIDRTGPRGTRISARLPLAQTAAEPQPAASAVLA
jgi:signal transduction histidine kinase